MAEYDVTFTLRTGSKSFADHFEAEILRVMEAAPTYTTEFGGTEAKADGLFHQETNGEQIVSIDVGDLFSGGSSTHVNGMTKILKKCVKENPNAVFSGEYDIGCFSCGDNAIVKYSYDGRTLIEDSCWDQDEGLVECPECGEEYDCDDLTDGFSEYDPEQSYICPNCGAELQMPYVHEVVDWHLENGKWKRTRRKN